MGVKKIILLLIVLSVLMSGCLNSGEDQEQEYEDSGDSGGSGGGYSGETQRYEEEQTPEETVTPEEMKTFEENETPGKTETAEEMQTPGTPGEIEEEQNENVTEEVEETGTVQPAETGPKTYLVRLKDYLFIPSKLEVNTGDLVVWRNYEYSLFTLTSEEVLFEDQRLGYGNTFNYTFNETGSYNFSVEGYPKMQMTITVK